MNKKIYNEDLTLNLIINGSKMKAGNKVLLKELYALDGATRKLQLRIAALEMKKRELARTTTASGKKTQKYKLQMKALDAQIASLNATIKVNDARMQEMRKEIGITALTVNQLNTHIKVLRSMLANATDPVIMKQLRKEITATKLQLDRLTTGASRLSQAWSNMARKANKYAAAWGYVIGTFYAISMGVQRLIGRLTGLDRKLSEVMKTTELTREEAYQLKKQFDKLNTPTKTDDLLEMAHIAGRLGERGVDNIRDFVASIDVLNVALGEDLGLSVEETAEKVGKLVNAFKVDKDLPLSEALLRTGSVLNELDKRSEASSGTILEYLTRLSSLGTTANYSMSKLAGMAATLNMINIPAERGSTALRKIISGLGEHAEKFSRILGVTVEEYGRLVKEDINGVFIELMKRTSQGDESIVEMMESMGDMEITGARVSEIYGGLAANLDMVVEQQAIADGAFKSSASVMAEFAIMSGDFAALIDLQAKRGRALADVWQKKLQPALYQLYKGFFDLLEGVQDFGVWLKDHSKLVKVLLVLYTALHVKAIIGVAQGFAQMALSVAVGTKNMKIFTQILRMTYTHGIKGLVAGLRTLGTALLANPVMLATATIATLTAGIILLIRKTDELEKITRNMHEEMTKVITKSDLLFEKTKQLEKGTASRADGIKRITDLYGAYLPKLLDEKSTNEDLAEAQDAVNKSLYETIALKYKNSAFDEEMAKRNKKIGKQQTIALEGIGAIEGSDIMAMAMGDFDRITQSMAKNGKVSEDVLDAFMEKWNLAVNDFKVFKKQRPDATFEGNDWAGTARKRLTEVAKLKIEGYKQADKVEREIEAYIKGVSGKSDSTGGGLGLLFDPKMSEDNFKLGQKAWERGYKQELTRIAESGKSKDEQRKLELSAQLNHYNALLMLQKAYNDQDLDAIADLRLKIAETKNDMREDGIKIDEKYNKEVEKNGIDLEALRIAAIKDAYARELEAEQKNHTDELANFKEKLEAKGITQDEYNTAEAYESTIHQNKVQEIHLKYLDVALEDEGLNYTERLSLLNTYLEQDLISRDQYERRVFSQKRDFLYQQLALETVSYAESKILLETAFRNRLISADEYAKGIKKIDNDVLALRKKYGLVSEETKAAEIEAVTKSKAFAALSEIEKQELLQRIRAKYNKKRLEEAVEVAEKVGQIAATGTSIVTNLMDMEMAAIDHKIEKNLISEEAGEKKKKEIRKKYADTQFLLATAEIVAQTAVAIMKTWAGYAEMPIVGQILAGIQTAMLTGLAVTQIAKANQARQQVKQLAKGKYPVIGEDDGKDYDAHYQRRASTGIYTEPTLIAEQPEMVVDYPTLRNMQINSPGLIRSILNHRNPGYSNNGRGASGGSSNGETSAPPIIHVNPKIQIPVLSGNSRTVAGLDEAMVYLAEYLKSIKKV